MSLRLVLITGSYIAETLKLFRQKKMSSEVTELLKIVLILLIFVFIVDGKKSKKFLLEPNDDSEGYGADVFCKKVSRLIKMEKADEILVVDTNVNDTILLQCKYCEEKDNGFPKTWSRQKHIFTGNITEIETDMENELSSSSLFISKSHSLVFKSVQEKDIGLYFCKAPYVDSPEKSFNYLIDLSSKRGDAVKGDMKDLKNFTQFHLTEVNNKLGNQTYLIHGLRLKLQVFTDWSDWSECDSCMRKEGIKNRVGRCRVKPICEDAKECADERKRLKGFEFSDKQNSEKPVKVEGEITDVQAVEENVMEFAIALSCRSLLLKNLTPDLFRMTSTIPDFLLSDKCNEPCKGKPTKKGPRYKKSIILAKGAHLTLVCPDSTIDSNIVWEHNRARLYPNEGADYDEKSLEPRQYVDSFNTLYLFEVTDLESGNYTCFVDGVRMQEVNIIVLTRSIFFTKEFTRHLKYLGVMFMLCFFIYLGGVIVMCVKTHSEKRRNIKRKQQIAEYSKKLMESSEGSDSET